MSLPCIWFLPRRCPAIAYKDAGSSDTPSGGSTSGGASPKTGDSLLAGAVGVVLACVAFAFVAGGVALRRRD